MSLKPLTVAIDAANGMAGKIAPAVFDKLPMRVVPLFFELDGTFPNHPADPIQPENLKDLQKAVLTEKADIGLAFDGDADRVFLVDEKAEPVSGSLTTALVAQRDPRARPGSDDRPQRHLLSRRSRSDRRGRREGRCARASATRSSSSSWPRPAQPSAASIPVTTTSGTTSVPTPGCWLRSSSWRRCRAEGKPLSELLAPLRRYAASGEINVEVDDQQAVIDRIAEAFKDGKRRPARWAYRVLRRLVVQRPALEHRAAASAECGSQGRRADEDQARRDRGADRGGTSALRGYECL